MTKLDKIVYEWTGTITGLLGSLILASNTAYSGWGFMLYLVSNVCWFMFGLDSRAFGLITMQIGYTITSCIGIYRWLT